MESDLQILGGTHVCRNTYTCAMMLKFAVSCDMAALSFTAVARPMCVLAAHETLLCMPVRNVIFGVCQCCSFGLFVTVETFVAVQREEKLI